MSCIFFLLFFFSSRRRHTSCALVTGVQTCALPIWWLVSSHAACLLSMPKLAVGKNAAGSSNVPTVRSIRWLALNEKPSGVPHALQNGRSEERRVGKECVSTCRSRWSPYHYKQI